MKNRDINLDCWICNGKNNYNTVLSSTIPNSSVYNADIFSARRLPDLMHGTVVKCKKCGLYRTLELVDATVINHLYRKSKFCYGNITSNLEKSYHEVIKRSLKFLTSREVFCEIGCGNGFLFTSARELGFKKVIGVEPSKDAVSKASKSDKRNIVMEVFREGLIPDKSIDLICAFQVFDHIQDPCKFLTICKKILKPSGVIVLMNHDVEAPLVKILRGRHPIFDIEHTYLYSPSTIKMAFSKVGFKVKEVYSPPSFFSVRHLVYLFPFPKVFKNFLINSKCKFLDISIKLKPGNVCAMACL